MRPTAQALWHQTRAIDAIRAQVGDRPIPRNLDANTVVYTGTHDNNTSQGWWFEACLSG